MYDADNRLIKALSSRNNFSDANLWITEVSYRYYLHGPLARMELGNDKVQGVDYAYTLQGWLKGVNSIELDANKDIGSDGKANTSFANVGRDVFGFSLGYYAGDYKPVASTSSFGINYQYSTNSYAQQLFNGNIGTATYALSKISNGQTTGYAYSYDQLNRIKEMNQHNINVGANTWSNANATTAYKEQISYDANGNILTYKRNAATALMDDMSYAYNKNAQGRLVNNKLRHVNDGVDANAYTEDIDNQQNDNYRYDKIGNLVIDKAEKIERINWNVYGKISGIEKTGTAIEYGYDASGNRITKTVNGKKDFYVRDAQGNVLALYEFENSSLKWSEQHLYGSSRIGIFNTGIEANGLASDVYSYTLVNDPVGNGVKGKRHYDLTNHLGNVMVIITDRKIGVDVNGDGQVDYFDAEVISQNDYGAFGMEMKDRSYGVKGRYGFNAKENDNETGWQDYGMRIYDRRLGKFLSIDPLTQKYPELTPYQFASNTPIQAVDLDGAESMFGWSIGLTPEQTAAAADGWNKHNTKIVSGTASGIKKSITKTWSFITSDAWKAKTWKNLGLFIEEAALDMSTVKIAPSPNLDAMAKDFKDNVINGDAFTRSEYFAEMGTDALLAKGLGKAFTVTKGMVLAERMAARMNFAESFYKSVGGNVRDVGGINLSEKVSAVGLNSNTKLYQWTIDGKLGDYFSPTKDAKNLGLPQMPDGTPAYFDKATNALKARTLVEVNLSDGIELKGLKSTAGDIKPWDGASGMNKGGDIQIYSPQVKASNPTITPVQ